MLLMIISGRSGAGKSVALSAFEDMGFYCVDNIPISLLPDLAKTVEQNHQSLAVSVDVRNLSETRDDFKTILNQIPSAFKIQIIYLNSEDKTLIRRYSETRRLHPLATNNKTLEEAILEEKYYLEQVRDEADLVINTDRLSVHELNAQLRLRVLGKKERDLTLLIESFGFKNGLPVESDFVFDARFLPNPHWDPALRILTGLDEAVQHFFEQQSLVTQFIESTANYLLEWLPEIKKNNRSYLTISIGCTGGQHRSVYIAEQLAQFFLARNEQVQIRHQSLKKHSKMKTIEDKK